MLVKMLDCMCKFVNNRLQLRKSYCSLERYKFRILHNYINQAIFNVYREEGNTDNQLEILMEIRRLYDLIEDSIGVERDKDQSLKLDYNYYCNTKKSAAASDAASEG